MRGEALQQALNNIFYTIIAALIRIFKMLQYDVNTIQYNMIIISGRRAPARSVSHYICDFLTSRQRKRTQSDGHIRVWTGSIFLIFFLSFSLLIV